MKNKKPIITFDEESFNQIKKMFGLKNLKCKFCKKRITKKNIGGFFNAKEVFCRNIFCLLDYIHATNDNRQNKNSIKDSAYGGII